MLLAALLGMAGAMILVMVVNHRRRASARWYRKPDGYSGNGSAWGLPSDGAADGGCDAGDGGGGCGDGGGGGGGD